MSRRWFATLSIIFAFCQAPQETVQPPPSPPAKEEESPREAITQRIEEFGAKLQNVSLLAPPDVLRDSMRRELGEFVTPELIDMWIADPDHAPGRKTSSPWPARIEVTDVREDGPDTYTVSGELVEAASTGETGRVPVQIEVRRVAGKWLISRWTATPRSDDEAPASVIEAYYAAINARDYERAYRYWASPETTFETFRDGFEDTASVTVKIGTPGRIDAAAGSRYIEIPVEIDARTTSGATQRFEGSYVLRRSVVDGATAEQRAWRIASADIRAGV